MNESPMKWMGGKRHVAEIIWKGFGDIKTYIEPFCGSASVLFYNGFNENRKEIINDLDGLLVNFLRTCKNNPEALYEEMQYPPTEADVHSIRVYLGKIEKDFCSKIYNNLDYYDAKIAYYWWYNLYAYIIVNVDFSNPRNIGTVNIGSNSGSWYRRLQKQKSLLFDTYERLKYVYILSGDWKRCVRNSITSSSKNPIGILLDPPYIMEAGKYDKNIYKEISSNIHEDIMKFCKENENLYRIALCGTKGSYDLNGWNTYEWERNGGFANMRRNSTNELKKLECIWFSPCCEDINKNEY